MRDKALIMLLCLSIAVGALTIWAQQDASASISYPLTRYSANPRYFASNGSPVVLLGAGQIRNSKIGENYRAYIDELAAHKVNYARVWHLRVWDATNNYFPWARDGGGTAKDGKPKYNLTHWDSNFWSRMKDACAYAQSKNIYLGIMLFDECGIEAPYGSGDHRWDWHPFNPANNVNGLSLPSTDGVPEFYALSNSKLKSLQELYVDKLVTELKGYPNVTFEICNEYTGPWDWEKHWIDFVNARCSNMITVNRLLTIPSGYWSDPYIDMVKFHWSTMDPATINSNMNSYYSKNRAINNDETPERDYVTFTNYRQMLWASFIGGGHCHMESGYNPGAANDASLYLWNFLNSNGVKFAEMKPSNSLVTSDPGGNAYTLAKAGSEYLVYIAGSGGGSMTMSLQSGISYTAKAYNPSNGIYTNLTVSGNTISGIPSYSSDVVVYVKASGTTGTSSPNVSVTLAVDKTNAVPGDVLTYTISYKNTGVGEARTVTVSNSIPAKTTYVSGSGSTGVSYDSTARKVSWNISSIPAGGTGTRTFKVKVD